MGAEASLQDLSPRQRLLLMRFVCSFVWADLEVRPAEREFVARLVERLGLDEDEKRQVARWLRQPPAPDSVDPGKVPRRHRAMFLRAARAAVEADGEVAPEERESLEIFGQLVR